MKKAGTIILACTFVVWLLSVLPVHGGNFSQLSSSVIGHIGHFIEPVIRPLGFDWKIGIGLLSSIVAREVIVGTLGTLYGVDPATHAASLQSALHHDLSIGGAIALVVFFAFAMIGVDDVAKLDLVKAMVFLDVVRTAIFGGVSGEFVGKVLDFLPRHLGAAEE